VSSSPVSWGARGAGKLRRQYCMQPLRRWRRSRLVHQSPSAPTPPSSEARWGGGFRGFDVLEYVEVDPPFQQNLHARQDLALGGGLREGGSAWFPARSAVEGAEEEAGTRFVPPSRLLR
jgi:hypothetical protein